MKFNLSRSSDKSNLFALNTFNKCRLQCLPRSKTNGRSFELKRHILYFSIVACFTVLFKNKVSLLRTSMNDKAPSVEEAWVRVIRQFISSAPVSSFSSKRIYRHFHDNENMSKNVCLLVTMNSSHINFTPDELLTSGISRARSLRYSLQELIKHPFYSLRLPARKITFLVMLNDGHRPQVATLGSARHWNSWNMMIPVPLGNDRGLEHGWGTPTKGWDGYVYDAIIKRQRDYPWWRKLHKAVFRGALGMQRYALGSCNWQNEGNCSIARSWKDVNRGVLYLKSLPNCSLFDIGFTSFRTKPFSPPTQMNGAPPPSKNLRIDEFQKYKMIINVGSNQDWAERLRSLLFMNSAVVLHEAETQEFFTPLLKPWVHYIPTNLMFTDLVSNVQWAVLHDNRIEEIVSSANRFASKYISEDAMQRYWAILLEQYSEIQEAADML